ncbi:MAG: T9SS type A sorting domain-containing protein [Lewinellaceae bacterium]|nr:T9SS type A sorting domain-containing protein [Lewinellaceae bacterium]
MRLLFTVFILCISLALTAQNDTWTYFAPPPDLSCQAARGNTILVGTIGAGIVRFDTLGNRAVLNANNSALPSDTVTYLAIDVAGNWWMIHAGGFGRFDGVNTQTWSLAQMGLPANTFVREMKPAPDSSMYVISDNGVAIFKNNNWSVLNTSNSGLPTNNVWDVAFGPDGKRYFATTGSGVVVQDGANWASYTTANTGITFLNNVFSVAIATDGVLWAVGGVNPNTAIRLAKFDAGAWTGFTPAGIGITQSVLLRKLTAGSAGHVYLTSSATVSILQQDAWTHYYAQEIGCVPDGMIAPVEDAAANIWIFTSCQLARFDGQTWQQFSAGLPGPPNGTFFDGIAEGADGSIWMGAYEGGYIARLKNDDSWEQYHPANYGATNSRVTSVQAAPDGKMWFGFENSEILRYANGNWTLFDTCAVHFPGHFVVSAATAPNGDQWFSFWQMSSSPPLSGLARYSADGQWNFFSAANAPLSVDYIRKIIFEADGTAWFATTYGGILRFDGAAWDSITASNSSLPSNRVHYLAQAPDGAIWAATADSGLARFDGQNWTTLNSANSGLPSNVTSRIAFDKAGGMYVGFVPATPGTPGARAIVLRGGTWTELVPPGWENSSNDELDAFIVDSQNRLWFAEFYDPGVYRYDPMLVHTNDVFSSGGEIRVFPNPASDVLHLQIPGWENQQIQLHVTDAFGRLVFQRNSTSIAGVLTLQLPVDWPAGIYNLEAFNELGERQTGRFVRAADK